MDEYEKYIHKELQKNIGEKEITLDDRYPLINQILNKYDNKTLSDTVTIIDTTNRIIKEYYLSYFPQLVMSNCGELQPYKNQIPNISIPEEYQKIKEQFDYLESLPQHEQKSKEWFDDRLNKITASNTGTALGESPYQTKYDYLLEKCTEKPFLENEAVHHGKKYEQIASMIYEVVFNARTTEFGLIPHKEISFLGASPDGICNQYTMTYEFSSRFGRMIEIKVPFRRHFNTRGKIDGTICPHYYFLQVQQQLECCDLEKCDFWQCEISEYENREEWMNDKEPNTVITEEQNIILDYVPNCIKKGAIIELVETKNYANRDKNSQDYYLWTAKYIYPPEINMSTSEYDEWVLQVQTNIETYIKDNLRRKDHIDNDLHLRYIFNKVIYWKLKRAHNVTVNRDREWFAYAKPKLNEFWNEIIYYREHLEEMYEYVRKNNEKIAENKKNKHNHTYTKKTFINYKNNEDLFVDDDEPIQTGNVSLFLDENDEKKDIKIDGSLFVDDEDEIKVAFDDDEANIDDKLFK